MHSSRLRKNLFDRSGRFSQRPDGFVIRIPPKFIGPAGWLVILSSPLHAVEKTVASPRLAEDGRSLDVSVSGLGTIHCHWAATIEKSGTVTRLDSGAAEHSFKPEVHGTIADGVTVVIPTAETNAELLFRVRLEGGMAVCSRAGVRNTGKESFKLIDTTPLQARILIENPAGWLLTGLHPRTPVLAPLPGIGADVHIHEHGTLYQPDGTGFMFGPVGEPVTYADFSWAPAESGVFRMNAVTPMDGVHVDPGETRWGQEVALVIGKPQAALAHWAASVARSHGARTGKGALAGWNNWNYLAKKDISRELVDVTNVVRNSGGRLRPGVIQMDYYFFDADLKKALESTWVPECRKSMAEIGARFGTHVGVGGPWPGLAGLPQLTETISRSVSAGFSYLKVYYPPGPVTSDGRRTAFEIYRENWASIRKAAGEDTYLLFCDYEPNRAAVGMVDASRLGPDANRNTIRAAISPALRAYPLHDRWFAMDGDTYYTGTDIANISQIDGSWPLVRTWLSMTGLSCGAAITSDPWYWEDFKPYWRNVEVLTPPARERTEVMDLGTDREWPRLLGHVRREWGNSTVALLWNPGTTERTVTLDFAKAGMDPAKRYAVWSFWDDRYLGVAQGSWTTPRLGPAASQHLVFTEIDRSPDRPVLIGSNLHIYCGAAEIQRVTSKRSSFSLELTDAGARDGDLYLYSRLQPVLASAAGCTVSGITSAGENVWRVSLHDRKSGVPQRIDMEILLPTSRQPWFWGLITTAILSLLFAAWRYVVGLRLERARALDQERARIARDIHDDLGASLTHIALLGELAQNNIGHPERTRTHVDDIFRAARKLTRSVDEVVWALNPSNDTLARFAAYVGDFTQDFLQPADIHCRLSFPAEWPDRTLPPKTRHDLFLVIKEALHNIVSHSGAKNVRLEIILDGALLRVTIGDDGQGFDPQSTVLGRPGGGHGLANMRQRMHEVGGTLDIRSAPGDGTTVILEVKP
jgi:signal transduction histidine kinase